MVGVATAVVLVAIRVAARAKLTPRRTAPFRPGCKRVPGTGARTLVARTARGTAPVFAL
jgi:hypothetical protein